MDGQNVAFHFEGGQDHWDAAWYSRGSARAEPAQAQECRKVLFHGICTLI